MPEFTAVHFGLLVLMLLVGAAIAWIVRADRCAKEKIAVSASWQDQLGSQQSEHNRLAEQNKSLMEQISQYQASHKDYSNRAKELSDALKDAFSKRDELQRQLKDTRTNLDVAVAERNLLQEKFTHGQVTAIKEKDDKIFRLSRELTSWQSRVPPLVERFQERDQQARGLEEELAQVLSRLRNLEEMVRADHTRIEPLDADSLPDGGDASNEPIALTSFNEVPGLQDQIDDQAELHDVFTSESTAAESEAASLDDGAFAAVFSSTEDTANIEQIEDSVEEAQTAIPQESHNDEEPDALQAAADALPTGSPQDETKPAKSGNTENGNGAGDDLQLIKGIGPSIEKTLHDLGIYRFHQIAEMSEFEIDRVAQQLRGFRSRIYREDWIGQARDLQYQKNNNHV